MKIVPGRRIAEVQIDFFLSSSYGIVADEPPFGAKNSCATAMSGGGGGWQG